MLSSKPYILSFRVDQRSHSRTADDEAKALKLYHAAKTLGFEAHLVRTADNHFWIGDTWKPTRLK